MTNYQSTNYFTAINPYFYKIYHLTFRLRIIKSQSDKNNPNRKFLLKFNIKLRNRTRKTNLY